MYSHNKLRYDRSLLDNVCLWNNSWFAASKKFLAKKSTTGTGKLDQIIIFQFSLAQVKYISW